MKVLIVDDSRLIRQVIRQNLQNLRVLPRNILEAGDGIEGAKIAGHTEGLALIITDLQMPHMDGIEFVRKIRSMPSVAEVRIIAISGALNTTSVEILEKMHVREFIKKPFDIEKFMAVIKPVLRELQGGDSEEVLLQIRSDVIQRFEQNTPKISLKEGTMHIIFPDLDITITLDNLLHHGIIEQQQKNQGE